MRVVNLSVTTKDKKAELNRIYRQQHFEYTECSCGVILLKSSMHNHLKSKKHLNLSGLSHTPNVMGV